MRALVVRHKGLTGGCRPTQGLGGRMLKPVQSWQTLGRGLPAGDRVYAIANIHGRADLLKALLERIQLDCQLRPAKRTTLVYLGGYVNHGPASRAVVDRLLLRPSWANTMVTLKGQGEAWMLDALAGGPKAGLFLQHGGVATLRSYGATETQSPVRLAGQRTLLAGMRGQIPAEHMDLLSASPDRFVLGDLFFCPAGIRPGVPLAGQTTIDVQTPRSDEASHGEVPDMVIVHGHMPLAEPLARPGRVNLDTGAHRTDRLTCGVFEDTRVRFITTGVTAAPAAPAGLRRRALMLQ
jgi:serine/threonine protein phosphatase 1